MKAKLIKINDYYYLRESYKSDSDGSQCERTLGTTNSKGEIGKLSKQNCDEIFGIVDIEKLAIEYDLYEKINFVGQTRAYKAGFNKAMELNKDKLFTLEDMRKAMDWIMTQYFEFHEQPVTGRREHYLQLLKQPIAIEVEIVTEEFESYNENLDIIKKPILDSEGCLILKKK